jgi:hypothetical protein
MRQKPDFKTVQGVYNRDGLVPIPVLEEAAAALVRGLIFPGLVLAEVELERADQPVSLPPWAGLEVTDDPRYYNVNLAKHPMPRS